MDINLRDWLTANLGTNDTVSALILVLMTILLISKGWWIPEIFAGIQNKPKLNHFFMG